MKDRFATLDPNASVDRLLSLQSFLFRAISFSYLSTFCLVPVCQLYGDDHTHALVDLLPSVALSTTSHGVLVDLMTHFIILFLN